MVRGLLTLNRLELVEPTSERLALLLADTLQVRCRSLLVLIAQYGRRGRLLDVLGSLPVSFFVLDLTLNQRSVRTKSGPRTENSIYRFGNEVRDD